VQVSQPVEVSCALWQRGVPPPGGTASHLRRLQLVTWLRSCVALVLAACLHMTGQLTSLSGQLFRHMTSALQESLGDT
jgi:hypothetical protein